MRRCSGCAATSHFDQNAFAAALRVGQPPFARRGHAQSPGLRHRLGKPVGPQEQPFGRCPPKLTSSAADPPKRSGCARRSMTPRNSTIEPGQPWVSTSALSCGPEPRSCSRWMRCPSMSAMNCGTRFIAASCARQSKAETQCAQSRRRNAGDVPADQGSPASTSSGKSSQSKAATAARMRSSRLCGTSIR